MTRPHPSGRALRPATDHWVPSPPDGPDDEYVPPPTVGQPCENRFKIMQTRNPRAWIKSTHTMPLTEPAVVRSGRDGEWIASTIAVEVTP